MMKLIVFIFLSVLLSCKDSPPSAEKQTRIEKMEALQKEVKLKLGPQYGKEIPDISAEEIARGGKMYQQLCASCHGPRGDASGNIANGLVEKPADLSDPVLATILSDQGRLHVIRKGIPGTPMMGWENVLSEKDILAIYGYVKSLIKK